MERKNRHIHLRPRLQTAAEMLSGFSAVADIGCDHGRLICCMLQRDERLRGIASDIGALPLKRAELLAETVGVSDRLSLRLGDGLSVLDPGEAEAVALLGMGGTVMTQVLSDAKERIAGAKRAVLQPMRAVSDIRRYLFENGYAVPMDRVVRDAGRLYQVFAADPLPAGETDMLPDGWPEDCFDVGYAAYRNAEPLLPVLVRQMLAQHEKRLHTARGTRGAALLERKAAQMRQILHLMEERI